MSPARPPDRKPELDDALAALTAGRTRAPELAGLSDLSREEVRRLAAAWPGLPEASRVAAVRRMTELAEDRIELNFARALRVALADDSAVVRQLAVAGLWEDQRDDLLDVLLRLVQTDPSEDVRAEAARALGTFVGRAVGEGWPTDRRTGLCATLTAIAGGDDTPYTLRRRALESVGAFADEPRVRSLVEEAYESDEQGFQASALYAMGRSHDPGWLPTVLGELSSAEAELRYEAARACGALGDDRVVPDLAELASDPDAEVRFAAIGALGQIGGRSAIRVLRVLAEDAAEDEAELIESALEEALAGVDALQVGP